MRRVLTITIFLMLVKMYLFQELPDPFKPKPDDEESVEEYFKPRPVEPPMPCVQPYKDCLLKVVRNQKVEERAVCAYNKKIGLINFLNICQLHLKNCFAKPSDGDHVFGRTYADDIIYYNGRNHPCMYYVKQTTDPLQLISLYYREAKNPGDNDV